MGGVDGLLKVPPHVATDDDLIEFWSPDVTYEGVHQTDIDVTGGIGLKITRGHLVAKNGVSVHLINGEFPERILEFVLGHTWRGTTILP
jgi:isopentenyl phosphate kinase